MKSDDVYLGRMYDSAMKILRATHGMNIEEFTKSETTSASVILWLTQIGEIAKRVSEETRARIDVPWKQITGFRDVAVHDYFELSVQDVWVTATRDIPEFVRVLDRTNLFKK